MLLLLISIHITVGWVKYLSGKNINIMRKLYKYYFWERIIHIIIFITIILLFSSVIEVYWSAPYFDKLYVK